MTRLACATLAAAAAVVAVLLSSAPAAAHDKGISHSLWDVDPEGALVRLHVSLQDLERLPELAGKGAADYDRYLVDHLLLVAGGKRCDVTGGSFRTRRDDNVWETAEWHVTCGPGATDLTVRTNLFVDVEPNHLHFARLHDEGLTIERVLTDAERSWPLDTAASAGPQASASGSRLSDYVMTGVRHILSGADHLVFLLLLLLMARSMRSLLLVISGFTLGHSASFLLTAAGYLSPDRQVVEALIGATVALAAVENAWVSGPRSRWTPFACAGALLAVAVLLPVGARHLAFALAGLAVFTMCYFAWLRAADRPERRRWAVACLFGVVHGFGFAGALRDLELPRARLLSALLGFNVGIEAGQVAIVVLLFPIYLWLSRRPTWRAWTIELGSALGVTLGSFWLVSRAWGGHW